RPRSGRRRRSRPRRSSPRTAARPTGPGPGRRREPASDSWRRRGWSDGAFGTPDFGLDHRRRTAPSVNRAHRTIPDDGAEPMTADPARATVIDGKAVAAGLVERTAAASARLEATHKVRPGLAVVIVGED